MKPVRQHQETSRHWVDKGEQPEPQPKEGPRPSKIMPSVWWDYKGVIYYELLSQALTANLHCRQLDRLAGKIAEKRPNHATLRFLHENAQPHIGRMTRQKLLGLGWEVLPHPPYSTDIAPTHLHLFLSLPTGSGVCLKGEKD